MTSRDMNIQTEVTIHDGWFQVLADCNGHAAAIHMEIDPITDKRSINIFSDDGRGNGLPIISFMID